MSNFKLSLTQNDCVEAAKASGGVLKLYPGGFWSAPDVEIKTNLGLGQRIPSWYFSTNTVRALLKKNIFEVLEEGQDSRGSFPVSVKLKSTVSD